MSTDFFGGVLDSVRHIGNDVSGFFNTTIGQAAAKGLSGGLGISKRKEVPTEQGFYRDEIRYRPMGDDTRPEKAEDFSQLEIEWLKRLYKFSGLSSGTEVKLGNK